MTALVASAFEEIRDGWSADRVIADPVLNGAFIRACRDRGLRGPAVELNQTLLNTRKRGSQPHSSRRTIVQNQGEYSFAAEMAVRALERRHQTTVDRILCDPDLAREFDTIAGTVAPGFSALEYRWAALGLRKTNRLKPEILGRVVPAEIVGPIAVSDLDLSKVPKRQGLYIFTNQEKVLYIGEAKNLQSRLKQHLGHSDNKQLARYLWDVGESGMRVEYHILPSSTRTDVRKSMELELIRSRNPEFNVHR